jgi:hypothetical protein
LHFHVFVFVAVLIRRQDSQPPGAAVRAGTHSSSLTCVLAYLAFGFLDGLWVWVALAELPL